jgi:hypothetical protein
MLELFLWILAALWLVLVVLSLGHLWRRQELKTAAKVVWTAVIVIAPFLGTVVYMIVGVFLRDAIHPVE